jgi:hypothetical protein
MDLTSIASRVLFALAIILVGLGALEWLLGSFGYTLIGIRFTAGRLLEIGVSAVIFVIALQLRQIREVLQNTSG